MAIRMRAVHTLPSPWRSRTMWAKPKSGRLIIVPVWAGPLWAVPRPAGQDPWRRARSGEELEGVRASQGSGFSPSPAPTNAQCDDAHAETGAPLTKRTNEALGGT